MRLLDKKICLTLNKAWLAVDSKTVAKAVSDVYSGGFFGVDIVKGLGGETYYNPLTWDDWIKLNIDENDLFINSLKHPVKIPIITIAKKYDKIFSREIPFTQENVFRRDNYTCQYSGRKLSRLELSIDHVIPLSRGGKNVWENVTTSCIKINNFKNNRTPEEAGLKLLRKPFAPKLNFNLMFKVKEPEHHFWKHFLPA